MGIDGDLNGEAAPDERARHHGDVDDRNEQGVACFDLDEEMEHRAGEMDAAADGFGWKERAMHFLRGERISTTSCPCVELAILMEASGYISNLGPMKNEVRWPRCATNT